MVIVVIVIVVIMIIMIIVATSLFLGNSTPLTLRSWDQTGVKTLLLVLLEARRVASSLFGFMAGVSSTALFTGIAPFGMKIMAFAFATAITLGTPGTATGSAGTTGTGARRGSSPRF